MNYRLYILMIVCGIIGSYLYIYSSMPETLSRKKGVSAYEKCKKYRSLASLPLCFGFLYYFCYNQEMLQIEFEPWLPIYFPRPFMPFVSWAIALAFLVPGLFFFLKGRKQLGIESDNPKQYHRIVDTGVYKYIRHPQLLGEICFWYFISFFWASPLLVLTTTFFWLPCYLLWCYFEEKDLVLRLGKEYIDYKKRTKFIIPFIL